MEPVEHMAPQGVAFRQARMVEVCAGIVDHAELLHDTVRAQVLKNGKEDLSHWSVGATAATPGVPPQAHGMSLVRLD
jgi:hypothetical protein